MRTAKQIFEEELSGEPLTQESVIEAIKQAQLDMLEYAVKKCSENADVILSKRNAFGEADILGIDEQSILETIDEIKEELK